jgi:hypothetical protein
MRAYSEKHNAVWQDVTLLSQVISQTGSSEDLPSALNEICAAVAGISKRHKPLFLALLNAEGTQAEVVAEYRSSGRTSQPWGLIIPVEDNPSINLFWSIKNPLPSPTTTRPVNWRLSMS